MRAFCRSSFDVLRPLLIPAPSVQTAHLANHDAKATTAMRKWAALRWPAMELLDRAPSRSDPNGAALPGAPPARRRPSPQERLESSRVGRWLLSAFLVAALGAVVLWNLPESEIRNTAAPVVEPVVNATGLDQRWNLFAPDPPQRTFQVLARIEYADGSLALWQPPRNDRWRKWLGVLRGAGGRRLREPTAAWIAQHHDSGGRRAVRVELLLRQRDIPAPGRDPLPELPWREELFYTYDVPGAQAP